MLKKRAYIRSMVYESSDVSSEVTDTASIFVSGLSSTPFSSKKEKFNGGVQEWLVRRLNNVHCSVLFEAAESTTN
jgi:hypothetical protein